MVIQVTDLNDVLRVDGGGDVELLVADEICLLRDGGGDFSVGGVDVAAEGEVARGGDLHGSGDVVADVQISVTAGVGARRLFLVRAPVTEVEPESEIEKERCGRGKIVIGVEHAE